MVKLRILLYSDGRIVDTSGNGDWGITDLAKFIMEGLKKVADVEITFVHRHRDRVTKQEIQGANKLAWQFLDNFHELWIFGDRQVNVVRNDVMTAQPYNELDKYERAVLLEWMKTRGLLFTGDHSDFDPNLSSTDVCKENHSKFIT